MRNNKLVLLLALSTALFSACKKEEITIPDTVAAFTASSTTGTYFVQDNPNTEFKIPVGITAATGSPVTIEYSVSSPTGAASGAQYTLTTNSITIPAGQVIDSISVKGLFSGYPIGRRDTLVFKITGGTVGASSWANTYNLVMQRYCDVDLNSMLGDYTETNETFGSSAYGPYTTTITSFTEISATKGRIAVENLYDSGWGPVEFELDWADPANFRAIAVPKSAGIADGATISSTYAGYEVAVRPVAGQPGTFNSCDGTFTLRLQLGFAGVGFYSDVYTVTLKR